MYYGSFELDLSSDLNIFTFKPEEQQEEEATDKDGDEEGEEGML